MKKRMNRIVIWFTHRRMRTKMTIAFSIPLLVIALFLSITSYKIIANRYAKQILYSAEQSYEQAISYLENHIQNMNYLQLLLGTNKDLQKILDDNAFKKEEQAEQYREYWRLDDIIVSIDLSYGLYHCALYVPDNMIYANNNYHFYPISALPDNIEWERFSSAHGGALYFSDVQTVPISNSNSLEKQVALLKMIYNQNNIQSVARVSISVEELERILRNSDITQKGFSYLINNRNEVIATSSQENEEYIQLSEKNKSELNSMEWVDVHYKGIGDYLVRRQTVNEAGWTFVSMIEKADFYQEINVVLQVFAFYVLLIIPAIVLISYNLARYFTNRLTRISTQMKQVQDGNWSLIDDAKEPPDEIGQLFEQFQFMTKELRNLMLNQYRLGKSVQSAELRALQAQINPHFLYNTLDLISWEARDYGADAIVTIVQSLAKFYRISLNKGRQIVRVADELEHIRAYVRIENYHFDNMISLVIDCEEQVLDLGCINIILQPFVENAIMYGIAKNSSIKSCKITIEAKRVEDIIIFRIEDDGIGMSSDQIEKIFQKNSYKSTHGYGAQNTNFRIKLFYGEQYGVSYESEPGIGTSVTIRIPALTIEEAEQNSIK